MLYWTLTQRASHAATPPDPEREQVGPLNVDAGDGRRLPVLAGARMALAEVGALEQLVERQTPAGSRPSQRSRVYGNGHPEDDRATPDQLLENRALVGRPEAGPFWNTMRDPNDRSAARSCILESIVRRCTNTNRPRSAQPNTNMAGRRPAPKEWIEAKLG